MDLYYRSYGAMEVLAHHVAEMAGLYQEAGVEVTLISGGLATEWDALKDTAPVTLGIGGPIQMHMMGDTAWAIVCVNSQYPLFWLVAQPSVNSVDDLKGARVAGRSRGAPPTTFLRIFFRNRGIDLFNDCTFVPMTDEEPLVLLQRGDVDAIQFSASSCVSLPALERSGFRVLAFIGPEAPVTTSGLVVNQNVVAANAPDVIRMVTATRKALTRLHADRELTVRAICEIQRSYSPEDAGHLYDRYIHPYWTHDGRPDQQLAEASLSAIACELEIERVPAFTELYKIP